MFERASTIIRDGSKLDFGYVPKVLFHREEQISRLESLFRPMAEQGRQCTAFLHGSVGTGKTVTARRFCSDLSDYMASAGRQIDILFLNCRNISESGVVNQIIKLFDPGFPSRGFSVEEMSRIMATHIASNRRPMLVVLDEADVLLKKGSDLIYRLTRPPTDNCAPVSVMLISQESLDSMLDEASLSTFRRSNVVRFNRYSEPELLEIVTARAEEALFPGRVSDDALSLMASAAAEYGDARMALELLDRSANMAEEDERGELTTEHVRAARAMIFSTVSESKLSDLDDRHMVVLLAVARAMKENLSISSAAAEKTYAVVCEEYGVQARKHTQYWTYLKDLEREGLLVLNAVKSSEGKSIDVSLTDIPAKVLSKKIEEILDKRVGEGH